MSVNKRTALIGYTGFVGGNLASQVTYDDCYNSSNISEIDGESFSCITIAAVQAKKWWANLHPDEDWRGISALLDRLVNVKTREAILISTIDVLGDGGGLDENSVPDRARLSAYGRHRLRFEEELRGVFDRLLVVRLPGLFGPGLKKNVIFDLLTGNELHKINPASSFQYYDLTRLSGDLEIARKESIELLHLFPEPISTRELIDTFFVDAVVGAEEVPAMHYDHRTIFESLYGGGHGYIASKSTVLDQIAAYLDVNREQSL